jgi:thymidylate synthase
MICGATVSDAWLNAVEAVNAVPERCLFHLVTHIDDPVAERSPIRAAAEALLQDLDLSTVRTVANTIFPAEMAARSHDHADLAARYRRVYPVLRRLHPGNRHGTYFGRIVAHPAADGEYDQLGELIRRLHIELRTRRPKSARYEMNISAPEPYLAPGAADLAGDGADAGPVHVYAPGEDTSPMGFPCLSFCSFQLDGELLHMVAHYRYQYLIQRGYGNYLGLGQLLGYVSAVTGLRPGQLMIVAGVATVEVPRYRITQLVTSIRG